jgi:hypothetical protein
MAISVTHQKVSSITDDPVTAAAGGVLPSDWNNTHTITADANTVLARAAGTSGAVTDVALSASQLLGRGDTGDVAAITLGTNLSMSGTTLNATGGGGSPAGSGTEVQYRDGSAFGAMAGTAWNQANRALTITGATVTTSNPILDLTQTWNAGGVTFTGLRLNVTDTASAAASILMDLQRGGTSQFVVEKQTNARFTSASGETKVILGGNNARFALTNNSNRDVVYMGTDAFAFASGFRLLWGPNVEPGSSDLFVRRRAAANLTLGNVDAAAPVAQTLSTQSVVGGTSNTAGAALTIAGSQGTGTGLGGAIIFQVAPPGSSGSTQNTLARRLAIVGQGSVVVGDGAVALATTATDGFLYVPTCAGLPTGVPTTQTGTAPIVVDTTNNKLYFYSGGSWRDAGP